MEHALQASRPGYRKLNHPDLTPPRPSTTHYYIETEGGRINMLSAAGEPVRILQIVCDDGRHADVHLTPEMVQLMLEAQRRKQPLLRR
jgi:hypothetical protein